MTSEERIAGLPGALIALAQAPAHGAPFLARRTFELTELPVAAHVLSTSLGAHRVFINGVAADDGLLAPGWSAYAHRVIGESRDVRHLLRLGTNVIVAEVAGGWYTENFGHLGNKGHWYGEQPAVAIRALLTFADGRAESFRTDASWSTSSSGPIRSASIYDGEVYDARRNDPSIHLPDFDDTDWDLAREAPSGIMCTPRCSPPVRVTETVAPLSIDRVGERRYLLDFGQNLVGRVRLRARGAAGDVITIRHAEVLADGELATVPLRAAKATDTYVLAGGDPEEWAPDYTFHGFRFAEISGWPEEHLSAESVTAEVIGTDLVRTGWFTSSSSLLNKLHENVVWSARGNFLSIPSDCPQRDERLGWTGDIQVFAPTAATLFDVRSFLENWLEDLRHEQDDRGGIVPVLVPDPLHDITTPVAGWGDAATTVPWALYERYGDPEILRVSLPSMHAWVQAVRRRMPGGMWQGDFQFGDWLDPAAPPDDPGLAMTNHDLVATAYAYRSARILADAALVIGEAAVAAEAAEWSSQISAAFHTWFATPGGLLVSDSVAGYALALACGLSREDPALRAQWSDRLFRLVRKAGYRISTGFLATPVLCDTLADGGHPDAAMRVLLQTRHPSWLAPVLKGATTVWERWDSLLEDGSVNPGQMTSFNHYALGAVLDFVHRRVAGLAPASPGYASLTFAPLLPGALTSASSTIDTAHGRASIAWTVSGREWTVTMLVPDGVSATFVDPVTGSCTDIPSGVHTLTLRVPDAPPPRPLDGLDTALSTLLDDVEAYECAVEALSRHDPAAAIAFESGDSFLDERTVGSTLVFLPSALQESVARSLTDLQSRRDRDRPTEIAEESTP